MSSTYGKNLEISLFGESHGKAVGCVINGFPAGFFPDIAELAKFTARRAPGKKPGSTARAESDSFEFVSGITDSHTNGAPITAIIANTDARSKDYANLRLVPRPGHADYTLHVKTGGMNDVAGGGHSSGRIMAGLTVAGGLAIQYLKSKGISVSGRIRQIAHHKTGPCTDESGLDEEAKRIIETARENQDSVGGIIECRADGFPPGFGDPVFGGIENRIAAAVFGIPAIKGIEFGSGFEGSTLLGSQNNDPFRISDGKVVTETNNHGGVLGGISSGMPIVFRVAVKPTPSISKEQKSVNLKTMENEQLIIRGRHDSCIAVRALPVVEAAAAVALLDILLDGKN